MTTKTINLYTFDELSKQAKEKAREWWRECEAQDFGGHGELNEPVETAAQLLGISLRHHDVQLLGGKTRQEPNIYWTLHVQSSGASFDGTYSHVAGSLARIKREFPKDAELHRIARGLGDVQARYGYKVHAVITSDSREHFLNVDLETDSIKHRGITDSDDEAVRELFRDFGWWIYKYIDAEYSYRMEDEEVDNAIVGNGYTFTKEGKRES